MEEGAYSGLLFIDKTDVISEKYIELINDAISSATFIKKPLKLYIIDKNDYSEKELTDFLKIYEFPAFLIVTKQVTARRYNGNFEKKELIDFLAENLK